jgi:DNA sulfur modification protein DndD
MRLVRADIQNFKLLEDVQLEFSTDPARPLTVVRAENGSGKTSLLYALLWGFYGLDGLPEQARSLRLTSSACPAGTPVDVQVMIEFEHTDDAADVTRYRLIRSMVETPGGGDKVERTSDRLRLLKITSAGEEDVEAAEALVRKLVPFHLRNIFFTNGDDVQTFISARVSTQQRQAQVHKAIRSLLGLDALRTAADDIDARFTTLRREVAKSGGTDVEEAERQLEQTDTEIGGLTAVQDGLREQLANMAEQKDKWERELNAIRGIGDLDELNARITKLRAEVDDLETRQRVQAFARMREALKSESCSWALLGPKLEQGLARLADLADRRVIPGASIEVLNDRLALNECICGEDLAEGSQRRAAVEHLRDDQQKISESRQRLTALLHTARHAELAHEGRIEQGEDFPSLRVSLLQDYTLIRDGLRGKGTELEQLIERRKQIDESRVRDLTEKIANVEKRIADSNTTIGRNDAQLSRLGELREEHDRRRREAEKAARVNEDLATRRDAAEDLLQLARGTLSVLEHDHVRLVSDRMAELFMQIVGSHPGFEAGVFNGVHISDDFDIVVDTRLDRTLDTDFELNGASQRALTLSFIWALMEVSGTTAPRIIDTPLGMVAGGVKTRLVDAITKPPSGALPDFQVILLLTRSEIRDVEDLLLERAGIVETMSCSKDYPTDLVYDWGVDRPLVRVCSCSIRESCTTCARHYDEQHGIHFRRLEEAAA